MLISNVCTRAEARGRGHATAAVRAVLAWAREAGVGRAELFATEQGSEIYLREGFVTAAHPAMRLDLR